MNNVEENENECTHQHLYNMESLPKQALNWFEKEGNDIFGLWDNMGRLQFVSKNVTPKLGYKVTELLNDQWQQIISKEDVEYIKENINKETSHIIFNVKITDSNGKLILFEGMLKRMIDEKTNEVYYISVLKDISHKLDTEDILVRSEKMSVAGQLAAGIAHEIRNPLTSLKGFLQLLQAGVKQKETYYQVMIEEIDKIEIITSELLFISKPLTNNKKVESVYSMLKDVIVLLNSQAHLRNIHIKLIERDEYEIYCDRSQIKQVFINVVKNAIEATDPFGKITIDAGMIQEDIYIDIKDEGPGIPENILHMIDEPFFTTKQSGTGLGLMITNQILEKHQGRVDIKKNIGQGSTFRIILPRVNR